MRLCVLVAMILSVSVGASARATGNKQDLTSGSVEYAAFQEAMRSRERILKSSQVTFRELTYPDVELAPARAITGYVQFAAGFEKWVRWEQILEAKVDPNGLPKEEYWSGLIKDGFPRVDSADGDRTLSIGPDPRQKGAWRGVLRAAIDTKIRVGALNCTIMFGERWLSDCCSRYQLSEFQLGPSGFEFTLVPATNVPNADSIKIYADAQSAPTRIVWSKAGAVAFEAIVLETVAFEGRQFPSRGELHYHYTPASTNLVSFHYEGLKSDTLGASLLQVPSEITSIGGPLTVFDELTRKTIPLGESNKSPVPAPDGDSAKQVEKDGIVPIVGFSCAALTLCAIFAFRKWSNSARA